MVNLEKREAGNVDLRLDIMDIFHSIQFDEITEEDFIALIINIDEKSNVYEIFQLIFYPIKKNKTSNEFTNMMKSYGFPTNRGVEYSLVQLNKTDHLEMVCTMPLSKTSPEWEKRCNTNIEGRILEKWSIVYKNNLYVFGNAETSEKTFQFGVKYCPPIDNWINVKELENGYKLSSLNAVGNYFIGIGSFDDETKKFAMKYDPNLDVWSKIKEMPVLLHQYAVVSFDETLLISGGKRSKDSESTREFWMYSLSENAWTQLPDMSYDRSNHVMLKNNSKIYFIGGAGGFDLPIEDVECFDMITQTFKFVTKSREAFNVKLRLNIMEIFNCIRFDDLTEEDFKCLTICIDESSEVYELFKLIFESKKKDNTANEFTEMIKSYEFPTSRGVEYAIVEFEKTEHLEMVCTMPLSKTSPEWEKRCTINIEGRILEKWSIVYKNKKREAGNVNLRLEIMNIFHSIRFDEITEEDFKALTIDIDESSDVYELFQLIFKSVKKNETTNEFKEMIKSYRFPTNRGVEYSLVQLNKTEHLEMVCTMPLSEKSPEWEKRRTINIGGRILDKWSIVYKNNNENLPTNISIGAQIIFESSFDDNLVLNDDNLFYILEAAHHFKLHSVESDCKSLFRTRMDGENSTETLIICQKYFNIFKGTLNLGISNVSKIFHELSYEQLYHIETKYVYFILNQNYKFDCNEFTILDVVLRWMIIYEKKEESHIKFRCTVIDMFHKIRFDEITEEDYKSLSKKIDKSSGVYEIFQMIFHSIKKDEKPNELTKMIKSYGFPTSRGVEQALVQLEESDDLTIVCTMPMSDTSPEWIRKFNNIVEGCVQEKWSVVHKNHFYVFGRAKTSEKTFQFGVKYCTLHDEWIKVKELEDGYELTSLNAVDDCFIGIGTFDGETKKFALKYDPNLDYWLKIEEMPVILYEYSAVALDGTLLISGGKRSKDSESTKDFWMFSLASNAWTQLPDMNYDRSNHVMLRKKSIIYFIGGAAEIDAVKNVEYFDMFTQSFELITSTGTKRFEDNQVVFNNQYFIKNEHKQTVTSSLELDVYKLMCRSFRDNDIKKFMYDSIYMYKT
ncbi:unnamed protein product [Diamesa hyperborea]